VVWAAAKHGIVAVTLLTTEHTAMGVEQAEPTPVAVAGVVAVVATLADLASWL
jgi:hypothetical protein